MKSRVAFCVSSTFSYCAIQAAAGLINDTAELQVVTASRAISGAIGDGDLNWPTGVAYCSRTKTILVAEWGNKRVTQCDVDGSNFRQFAKHCEKDFGKFIPYDVATSQSGRVFVTDSINQRLVVFTRDGKFVTRIVLPGAGDGKFGSVRGITCHNGCVLVCDEGNCRVTMVTEVGDHIRHIVTEPCKPQFVAVGPNDIIYVTNFHVIDGWHRSKVNVYNWDGSPVRQFGDGEGAGTRPGGVTVDHQGYVCVAWRDHYRVDVYNPQGELHITFGEEGDGPGQLSWPHGLVLLPDGRLVVCDSGNHRLHIQQNLPDPQLPERVSAGGIYLRSEPSAPEGDAQIHLPSKKPPASVSTSVVGVSTPRERVAQLGLYLPSEPPASVCGSVVGAAALRDEGNAQLRLPSEPPASVSSSVVGTSILRDEGSAQLRLPSEPPASISGSVVWTSKLRGDTQFCLPFGEPTSVGGSVVGTAIHGTERGAQLHQPSQPPVSVCVSDVENSTRYDEDEHQSDLEALEAAEDEVRNETITDTLNREVVIPELHDVPLTSDPTSLPLVDNRDSICHGYFNGQAQNLTSATPDGSINYKAKRDVNATIIPARGATRDCRLTYPTGAAYCALTNTILIADWGNGRIMRFDMDGTNGRCFVRQGGWFAWFRRRCGQYRPWDIAVSASGRVFVTDDQNVRVLVFTRDGDYVTSFGTRGRDDGQFDDVRGITCHNGCVLVCDRSNHRLTIFTEDGRYIRHIPTGPSNPRCLAIGPDDTIYVTSYDVIDHRYQSNVRVYHWDGSFERQFGDREGAYSIWPSCGVTVDHQGYVCLSWCDQNRVDVYNPQGELHTTFGEEGHGPGQLYWPLGMVLLPDGRLVVCDMSNNRLQIF